MMVQHHVHYKELHGYDEVVEMTMSEHVALHNRLRREGKCVVPVDELAKISSAAHNRGSKRKASQKTYSKRYRAEHREQIDARKMAYRAERKAELAAKSRTYYAEHSEERKAYVKRYQAARKIYGGEVDE